MRVGEAWWREHEWAGTGHPQSESRERWVLLLSSLSPFYPFWSPQPTRWCHPYSGQVFPPLWGHGHTYRIFFLTDSKSHEVESQDYPSHLAQLLSSIIFQLVPSLPLHPHTCPFVSWYSSNGQNEPQKKKSDSIILHTAHETFHDLDPNYLMSLFPSHTVL